MKTIGLLGGMSWESTLSYYKTINEQVKLRLGGLHSAKICLYSVDFHEIEELQHRGDWHQAGQILKQAAQQVERAGADFLIICTNTMHKVADIIQGGIGIPIHHIADATALRLQERHLVKVGLLGTRFTMEDAFYKQRLETRFGIEVLIPFEHEREEVHRTIYTELCLGKISPSSRQKFIKVVDQMHQNGAQAVILGCTEIALLIKPTDTDVPLFDTAAIHAEFAVDQALA